MMQGLEAQLDTMVRSADAGNIVKVSLSVIQLLKDNSLAMAMQINPAFVGVHPLNRDGYGVNSFDVASLLTDIIDCGWSNEEVHAVCVDASSLRKWTHLARFAFKVDWFSSRVGVSSTSRL